MSANLWKLLGKLLDWLDKLYDTHSPVKRMVLQWDDVPLQIPPSDIDHLNKSADHLAKAAWMAEHFGHGWQEYIQQSNEFMKYISGEDQ